LHTWAGVACFVDELHEAAVPQDWPAGEFPVALHTWAPVEQSSVPVLHGWLGGGHEPWLQAPQLPAALQTDPAPHGVPGATKAQVPVAPAVLQDLQAIPQALLQHTPSTQVFPVGH
jgi:hypothetical protein